MRKTLFTIIVIIAGAALDILGCQLYALCTQSSFPIAMAIIVGSTYTIGICAGAFISLK